MISARPLQSAVPVFAASFSNPPRLNYRDQLHPWCIVRLLPKMQRVIVARFRRRNDAEAHLRVLQRLTPGVPYMIVFDLTPDVLDSIASKLKIDILLDT